MGTDTTRSESHEDTATAEDKETIRQLREDKERLDWLGNLAKLAGVRGLTIGDGCYCSLNIGKKRISDGDDLREAIDANIRQSIDTARGKTAAAKEDYDHTKVSPDL